MSSRGDGEDSTLKMITIGLSQKTSQKVTLYEFNGIKNFLKMQKMHEYFITQQDVIKKHAKLDKLDDTVLKKLAAIPGWTTNKKEVESLKKPETT